MGHAAGSRCAWAAAFAAAVIAGVAGCGLSTSTSVAAQGPGASAGADPAPPRPQAAAARRPQTVAPRRPQTVVAHRMRNGPHRAVRRGTRAEQRALLGARVFADARHGFALADLDGETFPVATVDGGRVWRVDGPLFFGDWADAPAAVSQVGTAGPRTFFAYGGGGSVVDVTANAGRSWWAAYLGELVLAVTVNTKGDLVAVVQNQASSQSESLRSLTQVYISTDGGRRWRVGDQLGG